MILLDEHVIRHHLIEKNCFGSFNFHLYKTIDSTNKFLKTLEKSSFIDICCAEEQTQGRGRFGRQWISPFGENIYFSSRWQLNCDPSKLSSLSLIVALAILASLKESHIHQNLQIKWPNDILWGEKKLCGILIEVVAATKHCVELVIGIGINVNTATELHPLSESPSCSLYDITGYYFDRNRLLANLIVSLDHYINQFVDTGFGPFLNDWLKIDYLYGKEVTVFQPTKLIHGLACGVNELGELCLKDEQGIIHYLLSGDTSLRLL